MPVLKLDKRCKWCKAIKADKKLLKRIYASAFYVDGGESVRQISNDYPNAGIYPALLNHCKVHQGLTDDELNASRTQEIAKRTTSAMIARNVKTGTARQNIIDELSDVLTSEDFATLDAEAKIKWSLKALKDMDDVNAKKKDQDLDVFRMMGGIRSGETRPITEGEVVEVEDFDPWAEEAPEAEVTDDNAGD